MNIEKELTTLFDRLKEQRDEIEVQLHLAGMEAKEQWQEVAPKWEHFIDELGVINDSAKETTQELLHATKVIGDELHGAYSRIIDQLKDK